jgi:hypothetical protein
MCCLVRAISPVKEADIDEYVAMVECWLAKEEWRNSEKIPLKCPFMEQEFYMKLAGIEPEPSRPYTNT